MSREHPSGPAGGGRNGGRTPLRGEAAGVPGNTPSPTETQYHLFVERVHDYAIFLMDAGGVITHWGEGAERMKEFTPSEIVGRHLSVLYPPGGSADGTAEEHLSHAAEEGEYIGEGLRVARDRGLFPARVVLTSLWRDGELYGFSKVTQDLSERRRIEGRLEEALRAAEAASVEKSRFLATMSHEIRTPINAVLGYADLLDLEIAGPLAPQQRAYLDRVRESGRHLLALIEDVLDFSRVEAGRMVVQPERGRATAVVDEALALVRPQAETRGLRLESGCGGEHAFWGDPTRVRQILVNLLGNAVKFTPAGGRIRVTCDGGAPPAAAVAGEGPWTRIRVEDTGIGIPPDQLGSIFEPFVQVEGSLTREHQGTGLGLAISRRLARLQCGDLTADSTPGKGSAFTLWLPATQDAARGAQPQTREPAPSASLTGVGQYLSGASYGIVRAVADRLRVDPATREAARGRTRSEIEDHIPTFLADVAQFLVVLQEDGSDAEAIIRDGEEFQRLMAERHGRQRRRLGFPEEAVAREFEILHEEVQSALRHAHLAGGEGVPGEARTVLGNLLSRAAQLALQAHRSAGG